MTIRAKTITCGHALPDAVLLGHIRLIDHVFRLAERDALDEQCPDLRRRARRWLSEMREGVRDERAARGTP